MPADPERAPSPLDTGGMDTGDGMGEDGMMSLIHTLVEGILKPYAENVSELHKVIFANSENISVLQEKCSKLEQYAAKIDAMAQGQDKLTQFAESTRQVLDGFIDESRKIEQERAKSTKNLEETMSMVKSDMEELQKNGDDTRTKLVACQDAEKENRGNFVQLKSELHGVADNLRKTDETQAATIKKVDAQKVLLDQEIIQNKENKELAQEQRYLRAQFIALHDVSTDKLKLLNERFAENESQQKQFRKDFEQARDDTTQSLLNMNKELGLVHKEAQAKLDKLDTDLRSQMRALDAKGQELDFNLNTLIKMQGEKHQEDMKDVRHNLGNLEEITSKHEKEVNALAKFDTGRVKILEEEAAFTNKKMTRAEKAIGLPPLTKDDVDPKRNLKKRASSAMLGEDQLQRKAWAAWCEAMHELRQSRVANAVPDMQEMLKLHSTLIESEKSKLHSTSDRVQSLEADHRKLLEELQKMRHLNDGYWKGMTRGLQKAKTTMHMEGEGEMLPKAERLRNALPSLTSPTARPASSMS